TGLDSRVGGAGDRPRRRRHHPARICGGGTARGAGDSASSRKPGPTRARHRTPLLVPGRRAGMSRVTVLGAGSWGTTLAVHLAALGNQVDLWDIDESHLAQLDADRENRKFLSGIALPMGIKVQPKLEAAVAEAEFTLFVVPSHGMRACCER